MALGENRVKFNPSDNSLVGIKRTHDTWDTLERLT